MLKQGPPPENTRQKKTLVYVGLFIILGILISLFILAFENSLDQIRKGIEDSLGFIFVFAGGMLLITILISVVQTVIFKDSISKSKIVPFIIYAAVGGGTGGFVGGKIMVEIEYYVPNFMTSLLIGALIGAIVGILSSIGQNTILKSKEEKYLWVWYSLISNIFVYATGLAMSVLKPGFEGTAIGVIVMMFISGIALFIFLPQTSIEF